MLPMNAIQHQPTPDDYLRMILHKYHVNHGANSLVDSAAKLIVPIIVQWSRITNIELVNVYFSGSFSKGTAIKGGTDVDFLISISSRTSYQLGYIYNSLHAFLVSKGYAAKKQNVSIGISISNVNIDLVPAKRQNQFGNDHSLYCRRTDSWIKTNIIAQHNYVIDSGRLDEIRLTKIWRNSHGLVFPSFCLELAVIEALYHQRSGQLASNFMMIMDYLACNSLNHRLIDPGNSNNIVTDELTDNDRMNISNIAYVSRRKPYWESIVW